MLQCCKGRINYADSSFCNTVVGVGEKVGKVDWHTLGGPVPQLRARWSGKRTRLTAAVRQLGLVVVWRNGGKGIHFDIVGSC